MESHPPERVDEHDEGQDRLYAEDLEDRNQKMVDARLEARGMSSAAGGLTIPPLSSASEWHLPSVGRHVPDLPEFGRYGQGGPSGQEYHQDWPPVQVNQEENGTKHPLDEYFCKIIDATGPSSWERLLQEMDSQQLDSVGVINRRAGFREEKWSNLDVKSLKFPQPLASSVRQASLTQQFEADFIRHLGIISPAAAMHAKAVIAGVQRDLPTYRCRDIETTKKDWTGRATVNVQLSQWAFHKNVGILHACFDMIHRCDWS